MIHDFEQLSLSPFMHYSISPEEPISPALLIYNRCTPTVIEYESLEKEGCFRYKHMLKEMKKIFPLETWQKELKETIGYEFKQEQQRLTQFFIKRDVEIQKFKDWQNTDKNMLILTGKAGMGKSTLIAFFVRKIKKKNFYSFVYFFKRNDDRSNYSLFLNSLFHFFSETFSFELSESLDINSQILIAMERADKILKVQKKQIIIFLDGLDEAKNRGIDQLFSLPFYNKFLCIRWVLSGREEIVEQIVEKDLQKIEVGSLSQSEIYAFLQESKIKYSLLKLKDKEKRSILNEISRRSQGQALYLSHLVKDISSGSRTIKNITGIPTGLRNFYHENLEQLGLGGSHETKALLLILAHVLEPLEIKTVADMTYKLFRYGRITEDDWLQKIRKAVNRSINFLLVVTDEEKEYLSLSHEAFRDYLFTYCEDVDDINLIKDSILDFCANWNTEKEVQKKYGLKYYLSHVSEFEPLKYLSIAIENLQNPNYLEKKCELVHPQSLREDIHLFNCKALNNSDSQKYLSLFYLLDRAISLNQKFLIKHPQLLFQCLWNLCWWYDSPKAKEYYNQKNTKKEMRQNVNLHKFMEKWRKLKEKDSGSVWLESLLPPEISLASPLEHEFSYLPSQSMKNCFTHNQKKWILLTSKELKIIHLEKKCENTFEFSLVERNDIKIEPIDFYFFNSHTLGVLFCIFCAEESQISYSLKILYWDLSTNEIDLSKTISLKFEENIKFSYGVQNIFSYKDKIYAGCTDGKVRVWDLNGNLYQSIEIENSSENTFGLPSEKQDSFVQNFPITVILLKSKKQIVTWSEQKRIIVWDIDNWQKKTEYFFEAEHVEKANNEKFLLAKNSTEVVLFDLENGEKKILYETPSPCSQYITCVEGEIITAISHDSSKIAIFCVEKKVQNEEPGKVSLSLNQKRISFRQKASVAISDEQAKKDLQHPINRKFFIVDVMGGQDVQLPLLNEEIQHISFSLDSNKLSTTDENHTVKIWDINSIDQIYKFQHKNVQESFFFLTGDLLISNSPKDGIIRLWNLNSTELENYSFTSATNSIEQYTLGYNSSTFATVEKGISRTGNPGKIVRSWNLETGKLSSSKYLIDSNPDCFTISPQENFVIVSDNNNVQFFQISSLEELYTLPHDQKIINISVSPCENYVATYTPYQVHVWHLQKEEKIFYHALPEETSIPMGIKTFSRGATIKEKSSKHQWKKVPYNVLAWDEDEKQLITIGESGYYVLWKVSCNKPLHFGKLSPEVGSFLWASFISLNVVIAGNMYGEIYHLNLKENAVECSKIFESSLLEVKLPNEAFFKAAGFTSSHSLIPGLLIPIYCKRLNQLRILRKGNCWDVLIKFDNSYFEKPCEENVNVDLIYPVAISNKYTEVHEKEGKVVAYYPIYFPLIKFFEQSKILVGLNGNQLGIVKLHKDC